MSIGKWILGGGLLLGAGGLTYLALSGDDDDESKGKKGKGKGKGGKAPTMKPPAGAQDSDGVFRLDGTGLRQVTCAARNAKSAAELVTLLQAVKASAKKSGAEQVDVRNTGLVTEVLSAAAFEAEVDKGVRMLEGFVGGFFWSTAKSKVKDKLAPLPACDAPAQLWEKVAAGAIQQAVTAESAPEFLWGISRAIDEERRAG